MKLFFINIFLLFMLLGFSNWCLSQPGQWTWINGDSTSNNLGVYGVQGVSSPTNKPPSLYEPCEFKDLNGNFWLYGGLNDNPLLHTLNDLWKYSPITNEWTWMKGTHSSNDPGVFGIQGVPSLNNHPPSISWGAPSWVDNSGNFWFYGGDLTSGTRYGDLWKYDPSSNEWIWMTGNGTNSPLPVYGTMTIPNSANTPGCISECAAAWTDNNNNLWFFGGVSNVQSNTLWRYNIATNTWTWMKGSNAVNALGHWGTMGVEDSLNVPSGRWAYAHWKDNLGNFWLFGGLGTDLNATNTGLLNDLWRFNSVTNNWTWMSGSNLQSNINGNFGSKCIAASSNTPPARSENRAVWTDPNGDFWMYGGATSLGMNDLWKYCVSTNKWIWMNGDSLPYVQSSYGVMGVSNPANFPGYKMGAVGWMGSNGSLYLFGGSDNSYSNIFNDLWKFDIDTTCVPCAQNGFIPDALFNVNNNAFCEGTCISLNNQSSNASSYLWLFPGGTPASDSSANPQNICYFTQGNYSVTLIASNNFGSDTLTINNAITVYPPVAFSPINQIGDTLFSVPGYVSYQWYIDSTLINGAVNYYYAAVQSGNYSVHVIDSNGCTAAATLINVEVSVDNISHSNFDFKVQIFDHSILLDIYSNKLQTSDLQLTDELGKEIYRRKLHLTSGMNSLELKNINLSRGIYFIKIYSSEDMLTKKIFFN